MMMSSIRVNCHILPILRLIKIKIAPDNSPQTPGLIACPNGPISEIIIIATKYTMIYNAVSKASNTKSFIFKRIVYPSFL